MKEKDIIFIKLEIIEWKKVNKTMKQSEKVAYWLEIAEYDLETAKAMLDTKRYLYVGFMCHQAIEKILKAVYVAKFPSETPPYTHNLIKLARLSGIFDLLVPEQIFFVNKLEPLNIESH